MLFMYKKYLKRAIDIVLSLLAIIILAVPMGIAAVIIKLDSPGPVFFKQKRIGIHKTTFNIIKFRSMPVTAPHDTPTHQLKNAESMLSSRQKFIRKTSIDELPQIYNIFLGQMSIIGPRPALWNQYDLIAERGDLNVPANYVTDDGLKLGSWISRLRTCRRNGSEGKYLTACRIKDLDKIGMIWDVSDYMWQKYYGACLTYRGIYHNLDVPAGYVTGDGLRLGVWISQIRSVYRKTGSNYKLTDEQIKALSDIGMIWEKPDSWAVRYSLAKEYFRQNGNLSMSTNCVINGIWLGKWLEQQRKDYKSGKLPESKIMMLEKLNMVWVNEHTQRLELSWNENFMKARQYYENFRSFDNLSNGTDDEIKLGLWIKRQRNNYKANKMPEDKIEKLESVGVVRAPYSARGIGLCSPETKEIRNEGAAV